MLWDSLTQKLTFKDGVFFSGIDSKISYPSEANNQCFALEDTSFWFAHRANMITSLVKNFSPQGMIIDIGGGNGHVSIALEKNGFETALVEPGFQGIQNAKKRGLTRLVCATFDSAQFPNDSLPAVGIFDVLEHIKDDKNFLISIQTKLQPNGMLYLTVPAYQFLWSDEDEHAGHFRRYTLRNLSHCLESAGFKIVYSTYIFSFLPILILFFRTLPYVFKFNKTRSRKEPSHDHHVKNSFLRKILAAIFSIETDLISNKKRLLFGGSCLVAARAVK